jgi:RNA polymerase I-specific transcription initiation factor RRN6
LQVDDLAEASEALDSLLNTSVPGEAVDDPTICVKTDALQTLLSSLHIRGVEIDRNTLADLYRAVVQTFISSLPASIPGRTRLALEKEARIRASQLCLAGSRVTFKSPPKEPEEPTRHDIQHSQLTILPGKGKAKEPSWSSSIPSPIPLPMAGSPATLSRSAYPTPSLSGVSFSTTMISGTRLQSHLDLLKRYAGFTQQLTVAGTAKLSQSLSHWALSEDPAIYSWTTTQQALGAAEDALALEDLSEKDRRKAHRKADRHLAKQREEARKIAERHAMVSSQPIPVVHTFGVPGPSASQPAILPRSPFTAASRQTIPQVPVTPFASQVEPGRFGGRPPLAKKRKVAGF